MRIGSLFSGIGGLELGLEWAGLGETVWQVERDPYCRDILKRHWPRATQFMDVRDVGAHNLESVDLVCGGFPCTDISGAGKGAGLAGERSGLWYQFARVVSEIRPTWIVVENVASGARKWIDPVVRSFLGSGYEVLPVPLQASDCGAPHRRYRWFIVAADAERIAIRHKQRRTKPRASSAEPRHDGQAGTLAAPHAPIVAGWDWRSAPSPVCGVDDGLADQLDRAARLQALGNAVVPQCAEVIGWIIRELYEVTE